MASCFVHTLSSQVLPEGAVAIVVLVKNDVMLLCSRGFFVITLTITLKSSRYTLAMLECLYCAIDVLLALHTIPCPNTWIL